MNGLLGFAVLTGPLWLIVLLLPLAIFIAVKVSKRIQPVATRFFAGVGIFLLVFFIPFADEIAGRAYLNYLCATQAGVKVYQTVELLGEYWDENGKPRFIKPNGDLDRTMLGKRLSEPGKTIQYSSIFGIDEDHQQVVDNITSVVLGEVVSFRHWGGWIHRNLNPAGRSGVSCAKIRGSKLWEGFYISLFTLGSTHK